MQMKGRLLWLWVVCVLLGGCGRDADREQQEEAGGRAESGIEAAIIEEQTNCIVEISADNLTASGVVWELEEIITIITAAHGVQGAERVQIILEDGSVAECSDIAYCEGVDLAFLRLAADLFSSESIERYSQAETDKESFDRLVSGDVMIVRGSRDGVLSEYQGTVKETWIYMEDFQQYMMLAEGYAVPGMSGGGVFDGEGRLIGILCGGNDNRELAILPLSIILSQLEGI